MLLLWQKNQMVCKASFDVIDGFVNTLNYSYYLGDWAEPRVRNFSDVFSVLLIWSQPKLGERRL